MSLVRRSSALRMALLLLAASFTGLGVSADDAPPSAVGPLLKLLENGKLPPARLEPVAKMVCDRGNEHDLAVVYRQLIGTEWPEELRLQAIDWLLEAAKTRKVQPAGDVSGLAELLGESAPSALRGPIARLASAWKVDAAVEPLRKLAAAGNANDTLRKQAVDALLGYGGGVARTTIEQMLTADQPLEMQARAVVALAAIDPEQAAAKAAGLLHDMTPTSDPAPIVDAFLNVQGGAEELADAITEQRPSADVALLALRHMYAVGRSDPSLDAILSEVAGIDGEVPRLSEDEIKALAAKATQEGDAERGRRCFAGPTWRACGAMRSARVAARSVPTSARLESVRQSTTS
ncbi:MAG: hypothetical protein R3B90_23340 [Planctomycetaceae bacterium]